MSMPEINDGTRWRYYGFRKAIRKYEQVSICFGTFNKKGQAHWPALPPHNHIPSLLCGHPFPKSGLNPRAGFLPDPD